MVSLSAAAPTTSLLVGELLQGGDYAGVKTTLVDRIGCKLYEMVSELKEQVDKTDATATLSISIVKKAQQIEKLAKQIKDLAKG